VFSTLRLTFDLGKGWENVSRLTIIIPYFHDTPTAAFEETLASVLVQRPDGVEILVPNGGGYSDPWETDSDGVEFLPLTHLNNPIDFLNEAIR